MRPQVGQVVNNKYRLIRLVGDGGMGSVYEAHHEMLGTKFALKFLHPELSRRAGLVQRFLQEARVSAHIQSPHVVRVSDVDQTSNGLAFIVLEYLEGKTLQSLYEDLYRAGQRLSYADGLEFTMQMLDGVEAAHTAGIIHRDLKPDNVMITKGLKGETLLKLLDFGIAKLKVTGELDRGLTRPGVIMGTPEYMAPEQAYSADKVDSRADIFSLGVMIFEMLAGRRPVGGDEPHQIAAQYLSGQVSKLSELAPHVDPALAQAVHRAMAPMPKDRFATVAEFRTAIEPAALAAKVPSVMGSSPSRTPTPAVASPNVETAAALAGAAPAATPPSTNAPNDDGYRAVPKTLPPEDSVEPAPSPIKGGTPHGGFSVHGGTVRATPVPAEVLAAAQAARRASASDPAMQPVLPRTVSSPQIALNGSPPTPAGHDGSYRPEARPGGTDIGGGMPPLEESGNHHAAAFVPGTAPMDPLYSAPPPVRSARVGKGPSLLLILLLAAGVSAAVVGGVYAAHEYAKVEDAKNDPVPQPTPAVTATPPPAATDPPPTGTTAAPPVTQPVPPPVPTPTPKPTTTPKPSTTTQPTTPPSGSGRPTFPFPSGFPPLIIPSTLPTGIPPFPQPPGTSPPPPGTSPVPGPSPSGSTPRRPRIFVPRN